MAALPYVTSPGSIEKALNGIRTAATPERVSQDFVKTILKIPGGSGNQTLSFLKKIGFVTDSGAPSDLYKMFRNPATAGKAAARALRIGYGALYKRNEYMHSLTDDKLRGLILEETGHASDSAVATMIINCMKPLKKLAQHDESDDEAKDGELIQSAIKPIPAEQASHAQLPPHGTQSIGLNLSYTINLNLPATSDVAVFNAIFKSLKENLLKNANE